jgi:hypothetical protein
MKTKTYFVIGLLTISNIALGQTWRPLGPVKLGESVNSNYTPIGNGAFFCVEANPQNTNEIYCGAGQGGGIWKTTDGGNHWVEKNNGFPHVVGVSQLKMDAQNSQVLFANSSVAKLEDDGAGSSYGIFVTSDGGENWVQTGIAFNPWDYNLVSNFALSPHTTYPNNVLYAQARVNNSLNYFAKSTNSWGHLDPKNKLSSFRGNKIYRMRSLAYKSGLLCSAR